MEEPTHDEGLPSGGVDLPNVIIPENLTEMFDDLSFSDSSEFLDADEESTLRKRLFPQILQDADLLNPNLVCIWLKSFLIKCISLKMYLIEVFLHCFKI